MTHFAVSDFIDYVVISTKQLVCSPLNKLRVWKRSSKNEQYLANRVMSDVKRGMKDISAPKERSLSNYISVGRYLNGTTVKSLSGVETTEYNAGAEYNFTEGIDTYVSGGVTYNLVRVTVDGTDITPDNLASIKASHAFSGTAKANTEINLYYEVAQAQPAQ